LIKARINVRILTGDNEETAIAAGKACGLIME
jgi:magnesium-transporting ATPase (P-type)